MKEPHTPLKLPTPLWLSPDAGCLTSVIPLWLMETFHWEMWNHDLSLTFACQFGPFSHSFLNFCDCNFIFLPLYLSGMHHLAMLRALCIGQEIHVATVTRQHNGVSWEACCRQAVRSSKGSQKSPNFIYYKSYNRDFQRYETKCVPSSIRDAVLVFK